MIPWKTYWAAGGAVSAVSATALMVLLGVPTLVGIAVLAAAALIVTVTANRVVHGAAMFEQVTRGNREMIVKMIAAAAAVHAVLGVLWLLRPGLWSLWGVAYVLLALLEYGVARGHEYMLTQLRPAAERKAELAVQQAERAEQAADRPVRQLTAALARAGYDYLTVTAWETIYIGHRAVGIRYRVRVPSRLMAATKGGKGGKDGKVSLDGGDVEPIAIAMSEVLAHDLETDWVTITKLPSAGTYAITVLQEDAMARTIPYTDELRWFSITEPCIVGYEVDGTPYSMRLDQHGMHVGKSRSGKSSLVNVIIARVTLCRDARLWLCGVEKFFDLVWPWVEPYADTGLPMPFDWVASGPQDTAEMLAAAMRVARYRQSVPHSQRGSFKKIILIFDEASFALALRKVQAEYQGELCNMSTLTEMLTKGAGSGGVHIHLASQRGTNDNLGDQGGNINANLAFNTVFRSKDQAEVGRATGDWKLPMPRWAGQFWLEPGDGEPVKQLKGAYIQETDPQRARLHDGATIPEIAWARRDFQHDLDAASQKAAGDRYAQRYRYVDDGFMAYLSGATIEAQPQNSAQYDEARQQVAVEVQAMIAAAGWANTPDEAPPVPAQERPAAAESATGGGVATMTGRRTRKEQILDVVASCGSADGLTPQEIKQKLREQGDPPSDQVITNTLRALMEDEVLVRPQQGRYLVKQ